MAVPAYTCFPIKRVLWSPNTPHIHPKWVLINGDRPFRWVDVRFAAGQHPPHPPNTHPAMESRDHQNGTFSGCSMVQMQTP